MDLKVELQSFIDRVVKVNHIHSLLVKDSILIKFECEKQLSYLSLSEHHGKLQEIQNPSLRFSIKGGQFALEKLVKGEISLQRLIKEKKIDIQSTYRGLLLLESIFLLTAPKKELTSVME